MYSTEEPVQSVQSQIRLDAVWCPVLRDEKPQEMRQPNVFSKVSSQEDMRLARIKSTASGFAQSGFVKKELYAGFEIPAKETAMILRKAPFKKTAFRKQSEFFPRNTVSTKQTIW